MQDALGPTYSSELLMPLTRAKTHRHTATIAWQRGDAHLEIHDLPHQYLHLAPVVATA